MKKISIIFCVLVLGAWTGLRAQTLSLPYTMSFEDSESAELANWVINPGADASLCSDQWVRGTALRSEGKKGLFLSNDGGITSNFGDRQCVQFAYRDFVFEDSTNVYVSFDYICPDPHATIYAGFIGHIGQTAQISAMQARNNTAVLPLIGTPSCTLQGAMTWQNAGFQISIKQSVSIGREYRVYFAWVSTATDSVPGISGAIDNIQITNANCPKPANFTAEVISCDSIVMSWDGSSVRYQLQYRPLGGNIWRARSISQGRTSIVLESMEEGNYDFRVRGICYEEQPDGTIDTLYSPYTYLSNFNVFCPDKHCINYVAITDTNVAQCTYGTTNSSGYYQTRELAYSNKGVVDFGWESINSRHTVIWDQTAYDERTNNQLKLIPNGFNASVRLGNWDYNYGAEAITYPFVVDEDHAILLLHYAIVLEDPSDHDDDAMPRFVLEIKDANGMPLDSMCGRVDLNPLNNADWKHVQSQSGSYGYSEDIVYKDWTTMGLNLDAYVGQTLQISVATYDCFWSAHYGYAYFAMDCAEAHIKNTSCGAQQNVEVEAPEGFAYLWHNNINATTYNSRNITIGLNDPTDWICTLTSLENEDCQFDLTVNTEPRYPVAEFTYEYAPANCENRYSFTNNSFIRVNSNGRVKDLHDEDCDRYHWDFGFEDMETDGKNPGVVVFPEEGGSFNVTLAAMIGDGTGTCFSDTTITITVPQLGDIRQRTDTAICEGNAVLFHDEMYDQPGIYPVEQQSKAGCLIVDTLYLEVVPVSTTIIGDTAICYGETVELAGMIYDKNTTGDLVVTLQNRLGCDSVVVLHIDVAEQIAPELQIDTLSEEREFATIHLIGGQGWTRYEWEGVPTTDTVFDNLESGTYELHFFNDFQDILCDSIVTIEIGKGCLHNMTFQRWDDVVSLKNSDYNGGLTFLSYQWFDNDQLIRGATRSYYYAPNGLVDGHKYHALVTYLNDKGELQEDVTCPFYAQIKAGAPARVYPTCVQMNEPMTVFVPASAKVTLSDMLGRVITTMSVQEGANSLNAPALTGWYVLTVDDGQVQRSFSISVN